MAEETLGEMRFTELRLEGGAMSDEAALALAKGFKAEPGSPALPFPEPWGKELERRKAAGATEISDR